MLETVVINIDDYSKNKKLTLYTQCQYEICLLAVILLKHSMTFRGYPAIRALSAMRKHGGLGPFGRIPSISQGYDASNINVSEFTQLGEERPWYQIPFSLTNITNIRDLWFKYACVDSENEE